MNRRPFLAWMVSPAAFLVITTVAALLAILQFSVRAHVPGSMEVGAFTFRNFVTLWKPTYGWALLTTVQLCLETAVITLLVSYPLAYTLVRSRSRAIKSIILVICVTPLFLGEVVRTYSWIMVLGTTGFLNKVMMATGIIERPVQMMFNTFGVVVALVHVSLPLMVVLLSAALSGISREYEKAAESLGAGPIRTFLTVTLPLSTPGIIAAVTTSVAWTFSAFATPQLIGGGRVSTVSTLVYQVGFAAFNFPFAASLSVLGLALTLATLGALAVFLRPLKNVGTH
jgi:putative spermidine/putrescine transport system permease protein